MVNVFLLLLPLLVLFSVVYWSLRNGISPTPTGSSQAAAILQAIPPGITGNIYDLGSGWGTLAIAMARKFPNCRITGIENSPVPCGISKILAFLSGLKNIRFQYANFLTAPLDDATLIVCYLYPGGMTKLKPKLEDLQTGTIVISNTFSMPGWKPEETLLAKDLYKSPVYIYVAPASRPY